VGHDLELNRAHIAAYANRLVPAEGLILVYPVWNEGFPAILKGFFDRVFIPGVSFTVGPRRSAGNELAKAAKDRCPALSHQPFLLIVTCLAARIELSKFNDLASQQNASRAPFLVRCDSAEGRDVRFRENEQRSQASDFGANRRAGA
jgi:Flavodoxin-like fold